MQTWPLIVSIFIFPIAAIVICLCEILIIKRAEISIKATEIGQAIYGALFMGATTSLSGFLITSLSVAYQSYVCLAVSNSLGSIRRYSNHFYINL